MQNKRKVATLLNPELEKAIELDGFVRIPSVIPPDKVRELKDLYTRLSKNSTEGENMWNSLYNLSYETGIETSEAIRRAINPILTSYFEQMKVPAYTFMVKNCGQNTFCELHRDFSSFEEDVFEYRNGWIPLVDIDESNGALIVVPNSQRVFEYCLPMFTEWPYKNMITELRSYSKVIHAKAGDLIIYSDRTLHGSEKNSSRFTRPVVHFGLLPPEAQLSYYHLNNRTNEVEIYPVEPEFYFSKNHEEGLMNKAKSRHFKYEPPDLSFEAVKQRLQKNFT